MEYRIADYFARFAVLSQEEYAAIAESAVVRHCPKGTILLEAGQVSKECYFVLEGCVREYYVVDGEEKTTGFFTEEQWVVSISSFTNKTPADHFFACIEDAVLVVGSEDRENELYRKFPRFETLSRLELGKVLAEQQRLRAMYVTDSPEERYLRILERQPLLLQRVPQYQLASYIGVKPESLSRIRKRILTRQASGSYRIL
jgi:CRP-like cAMP-binding protein